MNVVVRTTCPSCGFRDGLTAETLLVAPAVDGKIVEPTASWVCLACLELVGVPVAWDTVDQLVSAGAPLLDVESDLRPAHPERSCPGPAFTKDDLLELHDLLAANGWQAAFADDRSDAH